MRRLSSEWEVETNGITTLISEWGAGDRHAVLLHGVSGNRAYWSDLSPSLAQLGWHVWAPNLRGAGRVGGRLPDDQVGRDIETYVSDLVSWMDAAGIELATVAGHSFGGRLAVAFAAAHPERVEKLILIAAAGPDALTEVAEQHPELVGERGPSYASLAAIHGPAIDVLRQLRDRNPAAPTTRAVLLRWIENLKFDEDGNARHADIAATCDAQMAIIRRDDQTPLLEQIECPVIVMRSVDESPMLRHTIPHYVEHLPNATFIDRIHGGHDTPTAAPTTVLHAFHWDDDIPESVQQEIRPH